MKNDKLGQYKKYLYKLAIFLIVGLSLIFITVVLNSYYELLYLPATYEAVYLGYGIIIHVILLLVISIAWKYNILICTDKALPIKSCFSQVSLVLVGKYLPGKIWGMYARSLNLLSHNITYKESLLGTYFEQIISVHAGLSFGILSWFIAINSNLLIPVFLLIVLSIFTIPLLQNSIFRFISNMRNKGKKDNIDLIWFELDRYSYLKLFFLYLLEWLFVGLILVVIYYALFNEPKTVSFIILLMGSSAIAFVIGFFAIFAPGGIGVREGILVAILSQHIQLADSVILVIAFRLWFTSSDIVAGLLGLALSNNSTK